MPLPDPTFPPLLHGHGTDARGSVFTEACARARAGQLGAGDVVWSRRKDMVEVSVVLEPEVAMDTAVQMLPLCMVALGDCLGALTPPQVGVSFVWPDRVCINGAQAGYFEAAAASAAADEPPDWLAVGLTLRHQRNPDDPEPGDTPDITWLSEEGGAELTRSDVIESYCRHFLTWINLWNDDGFRPVHAAWLFRAENRDEDVSVEHAGKKVSGRMVGLDDNGNLLVKDATGNTVALHLADVFERSGAESAT